MRCMMLKNKFKWIAATVIILGTLFTTCEMPMGLGPPVDTIPPNIYIDLPEDNTKMKAITEGNPVVMEGTWMDDINVTSLEFEFRDKWHGNEIVPIKKVNYKITPVNSADGWVTGTWRAEIVIDPITDGGTEYRIRVYALDKFGNKGMAEVNVQIDIIPPWVDSVLIQRHPNHYQFANTFVQDSKNYTPADTGSLTGKQDSLPSFDYYVKKGFDFNNTESWRNIKFENIDEFQNEFFRISTELIAEFNNVAAVRLNIYRENGALLSTDLIKPTGYTKPVSADKTHLRYPYWDITSAQMIGYDQQYAGGPHYIFFEIRAWSSTDWDDAKDKPNTDTNGQEEQGRTQRIGGTVWFPESNNPIAYIDKKLIVGSTNSITLTPNTPSALDIDVYDDDLLSEIYLGLIPKDDFDALRRSNGNRTEDEFLKLLGGDSNSLRTSVMDKCIPTTNPRTNLFIADGNENRLRNFKLNTGAEGEYRLIAIVKEGAKTTSPTGYTYPPSATPVWSVYPPLRIQVLSAMAPLIIVENPTKDNAFPNLRPDGRSFLMSGYTLAGSKVNSLYIAWVPQNKTAADANTAIEAAKTANLAVDGRYNHAATGVQVWNVSIIDEGEQPFGSTIYYRSSFSKPFDLLNDFPSGVFNSSSKINLFVLQANAINVATKNFPLLGSSAQPTVEVIGHTNVVNYHDRNKDLVLKMRVGTGSDGVALQDDTFQKITDIAGSGFGLSAVTSLGGGEYQATVTSSHILTNFAEGSQRNYKYEAENILGNRAEQSKTIVMSNAPLIESISCTNGPGTYAMGEELLFEVTFTMPVLVNGSPRLKLYFNNIPPTSASNTPTPTKYADYVPPTDSRTSNTLNFKYTVALNDESSSLKNSLAPIDLNGATLKSYYDSDAVNTLNDSTTSMQRQIIKLDGVCPKVERVSFAQTGTAPTYFKKGSIITINLLCSEPVMVSGTPKIQIATMSGDQKNLAGLAEYSSITGNTLKFTYTVTDSDSFTQESQLTWATPWIDLNSSGAAITDAVGNPIDYLTAALPSAVNRRGEANGSYPNETAYIKTSPPATPTLAIYNTQAGAQNATAGALVSGNNVSGQYFYIRANNIATTGSVYTVYYSLTGGSNAKTDLGGTGANRYSTGTANAIVDPNYADRIKTSYEPTSYQITVWQKDRADNESEKSVTRDLTINSRPAELLSADISLQDGAHPVGTVVPFKLSFSQKITMSTSSRVTFAIAGTSGGMLGTASIPATAPTSTVASSMVTVNWTVPSGIDAMQNIKITNISFTSMSDEYGNALLAYSGPGDEDITRRPITNSSSFQINRPDIIILSNNPRLVDSSNGNSTTPAIPTGTGQNGGMLSGKTIKLVFAEGTGKIAVPLTAVAGKYITIRPYGNWAIPPILSVDEFNTVYNFNYGDSTVNTNYRRRLSDVDDNGLAKSGSGRESGYNSYIKNTHGLSQGSAGNVRPDTSTKMVLDFTTGLYDGNATNLRAIFNAAGWKQQKILVTSSNVKIENGNVIAITIPTDLDVGRIWEVLVDEGAFQDNARNLSTAVAPGAYRFWSAGTADPIIRVDKVSYDARNLTVNGNNVNAHNDLQFVNNAGNPNRPPIDTRVRIDCETPGADIRYDVIRTSYTLNPGRNANTSDAFTSSANTANDFFHRTDITSTAGYDTNNIGNDNVSDSNNRDGEGFFKKLLVPNNVDTGTGVDLNNNNGTFPMSTLTNLGGDTFTITQGGGSGYEYQRYNSTTGAITWGNHNISNSHILYIGEMYGQISESNGAFSRIANADTNFRLFSGRRDYIIAKAQKFEITAVGDTNGPALAISKDSGMEGVYKTTFLYRNPTEGGTRARRVLVQGFDIPVMPIVAGFPLRDADSTNTDQQPYNNIFSKNAWYSGCSANSFLYTTPDENVNNHIWVTWEIVTDWYQKGKAFNSATNGNYLSNNNVNANSVAATYGGVIYRYNQAFY